MLGILLCLCNNARDGIVGKRHNGAHEFDGHVPPDRFAESKLLALHDDGGPDIAAISLHTFAFAAGFLNDFKSEVPINDELKSTINLKILFLDNEWQKLNDLQQ